MGTLDTVGSSTQVVVLSLSRVPAIDATGLVALESALWRLMKSKKRVVLAGPLPEPRSIFNRANLSDRYDHVTVANDLSSALKIAEKLARPA
jgi:sulfate permease, SulP family